MAKPIMAYMLGPLLCGPLALVLLAGIGPLSAGEPGQQVDGAEDRQVLAYPFRLSPKGWPRDRRDLQQDLEADRPLDLADVELLLDFSQYLVDRRNPVAVRKRTADDLGALGHRYGLPALLAVLRNPREPEELRRQSVRSLANIKDRRVVGFLIEHGLRSASEEVAAEAREQLVQFVAVAKGFPEQPLPEEGGARQDYVEQWRMWWKEQAGQPVPLQRACVRQTVNQ